MIPVIEEQLSCEREIGNAHDTHAVAIRKIIDGELKSVGHVPRRISLICSIFVRRGGSILCIVRGSRRYSSDLPQGGLEIPCTLEFISRNKKESAKAERLLESSLSKKVRKKVLKEIKENDNFNVSVATIASAKEEAFSTMCRCQKQVGGTDCGLFSIAFADALAHGMNPGMLKFHQDKMRSHLVDCFNKQIMIPFPCQ